MLLVHAYIEVTEPTRGLAFYCEGLGLSLKRKLGPRWFELAGANVPILLLANQPELADLGSRKVKRSYERHWTPVHLDFIVEDLDFGRGEAYTARWCARSPCRAACIRSHRLHGGSFWQWLRLDRVLRRWL